MLAKFSHSNVAAFLVFVLLVWVAVDMGIILAGLAPNIPPVLRTIMNPNGLTTTTTAKLDSYAA